MQIDIERLETKVKETYGEINNFSANLAVKDFLQGSIYYCEFDDNTLLSEDKGVEEGEDKNFCYAFINPNEVQTYDDGIEVIKGLQLILDKRRNFWQRVNEFSLVEMIGATIALLVTITFVALSFLNKYGVNKEFMGVFSLIAGYYFGRNIAKDR